VLYGKASVIFMISLRRPSRLQPLCCCWPRFIPASRTTSREPAPAIYRTGPYFQAG